jgi:predicted permease
MRVRDLLTSFVQDANYSSRVLRRAPGLALTIVISMAIGVGANAAVFSLLDRVYFRAPEGVVDPGSVRRVYFEASGGRGFGTIRAPWFGIPHLRDLAQSVRGIADLQGFASAELLPLGSTGDSIAVGLASPGLLPMLGVRAERGRFFGPDENRYGDPRYVAVLSDGFWRRHLGADSAVIGRTLILGSGPCVVIGVAQPGFEGLDLEATDMWLPLAARGGSTEGRGPWYESLRAGVVQPVLRLGAAESEQAITERLTAQYRRTNAPRLQADPKARILLSPVLEARGPTALTGLSERNLSLAWRLAGVALAVLIIAITNVASLLLMRALRRRREIAVRLALGASRRRLLGQGVGESVALAFVAASAALLATEWTGSLLRVTLLGSLRWSGGVVDHRIVFVAYGLAILGGLAAGLIPGFLVRSEDIALALKAGAPEAGGPASRLGLPLLVVQVALCMGLLAGTGVFLQSLRRAKGVDHGFDADRLITVVVAGRPTDQELPELASRIRSLPDVLSLGSASMDLNQGAFMTIANEAGDTLSGLSSPFINLVDPDFLQAAGVHLVAGRLLSDEDGPAAARATVVTTSLAQRLFPRGAVGQCMYALRTTSCTRVVGVIEDLRWDVTEPTHTRLFLSLAQAPRPSRCCLLIRTRGAASAAALNQVASLAMPALGDKWVRVWRVSDRLEPYTRPWRVAATLFALFGVLALLSAACGVYGLVGYDVTRRTREFGVRIALGASPEQVWLLALQSQMRTLALAMALGVVVALGVGRASGSLLFATSAFDPVAIVGAALTLAVAALIAAAVPAWRATRIDPVATLRAE